MKSKRRLGFTTACLALCAVCVAHLAAAGVQSLFRSAHASEAAKAQAVLHGKRLVTLGRYELNVAFAPDGTLYCFEISAKPARADAQAPAPRA